MVGSEEALPGTVMAAFRVAPSGSPVPGCGGHGAHPMGHQHCPLGGATLCCLWGLKAEAHAYLPAVRAWPSIGARRQGPGRRVDEGAAALCQPSRQPRHLPTPVGGSSRLAWAFCFLADQQGLQWTLPRHVQFGAGPRAAPRARK